jgi:hypothetical protein
MNMRRLWPFIYVLSSLLIPWGGYCSLDPAKTANTNADWVFVSIVFVMTCLFPLGAMAYSRRIGVQQFRRPSFDRSPFGWWRDTLQPLRLSVIGATLSFLGACFALPHADNRGVMIFWSAAACAIGLFIGERLVYVVFRQRIA